MTTNLILFIIAIIVSSALGFYFGIKRKNKKYEEKLSMLKLENSTQEKAWMTHCKSIREHFQNALIDARKKHNKCTSEQKVLYQNKYEIDACTYKVKEKYHNVTIEVLQCTKCGHTEISWFRQDDTEEVEVE